MTEFTPLAGVAGGILIGLSAVLLMASLGRIAGISGIFRGMFADVTGWQGLFLLGLLAGTILMSLLGGFDPDSIQFPGNPLTTLVGGLLVGVGTALGAGCTSGHGICGIARLSERSIAATAVFMAVAVITVYITRHVVGG